MAYVITVKEKNSIVSWLGCIVAIIGVFTIQFIIAGIGFGLIIGNSIDVESVPIE